jgi:hypothetical protein
MRLSFLNIFFIATFILVCFISCDKVNVPFDNQNLTGDPSLTYFNNYKVSLQTLEIDSFLTSGRQLFTVGYHNDSLFGSVHAGTYLQFNLPGSNPFLNQQNIVFDSLQIILKPNGTYLGDTTKPFYFKVYQLQELIENTATISNPNASNLYYNPRTFAYNPVPLGEQGLTIFPKKNADSIAFRMSDALGRDLLSKFQGDSTEITTQTNFINYFNGIYIDADTALTNTVYNFGAFTSSGVVMRLYYDVKGTVTTQEHFDFAYSTTNEFNHISYNHPPGTPLSVFTPPINNNVFEILNSSQTGNKAYLNSSTGYFVKIGFPNILSLKALYPYVRVVRAQLVIPPSPGTYNYPYELPPTLNLYETDINNGLDGIVTGINGAQQTGDLFIDYLYGQSTQYTYDVTNFVSTLLNQPNNSDSLALILSPSNPLGDESFSRLVINDQTLTKDVQLQLYVLGI